jgi:uncharacterized protein (TIGR03067 family)
MKLITVVCVLTVAQFAVAADDDAEARKKLVGVWKGRVKQGATGHEITFTLNLIKSRKDKKRDLGEGTFKLDLTKKPWRMDATRTKGGRKGRVFLGIYALDGDTLQWCVRTSGTTRPTEFTTGNGNYCLILKRQKEEEKIE